MVAVAGYYKFLAAKEKKFVPKALEVDSCLAIADWA